MKTDLDLTETYKYELFESYANSNCGSVRNVEMLLDLINSSSIIDIDEATLLLNILDNFDNRIRKPLRNKIIELMEKCF